MINETERDMIIGRRNGVIVDWITRSRVERGESRECESGASEVENLAYLYSSVRKI